MAEEAGGSFESSQPDFYMGDGDGFDLQEPRACWRIRRIVKSDRDDYLLIRLSPKLLLPNGTRYSEVTIASRYEGDSLFPINRWPITVSVGTFEDDRVTSPRGTILAIAELWKSRQEVINARSPVIRQGRGFTMPTGSSFVIHNLRFVGEQLGQPETDLKNELNRIFEGDVDVISAYLAKVAYEGDPSNHVALLVRAAPGRETELRARVAAVFSQMFAASQGLDVIFLDSVKESALSCVCRPFFQRRRNI